MNTDGDSDDGEYGDDGQIMLKDDNGYADGSDDACRSDVRG
jgi:hypothetical protein